jgi:hypothetical protein
MQQSLYGKGREYKPRRLLSFYVAALIKRDLAFIEIATALEQIGAANYFGGDVSRRGGMFVVAAWDHDPFYAR